MNDTPIDLTPLLDDNGLTAPDASSFGPLQAERLGRTLGTVVRRRGHGQVTVALARSAHAPGPLRDALVRGLVLSGQDVRDIGVVPEPVWAERASGDQGFGAFVSVNNDCAHIALRVEGGFVDEVRGQLAEVYNVGDFAAGEGCLEVVAGHG